MRVEEEQITLRKLIAADNRVIVSKELDEKGNPKVVAKQLYLGVNDAKSNYKEITEETYKKNLEVNKEKETIKEDNTEQEETADTLQ